jgi:hypothetical protein
MYEAVKAESWSISLSGYRMGPKLHAYYGVVTTQEVFGSQWLPKFVKEWKTLRVYVDTHDRSALDIYGMVPRFNQFPLSNVTIVGINEFVYLGRLNTFYGMVTGMDVWNITSINDFVLSSVSIVYSNGDCEIYKNTC